METSRADSERSGSSKVKAGRYADRVGSDSIVVGREKPLEDYWGREPVKAVRVTADQDTPDEERDST